MSHIPWPCHTFAQPSVLHPLQMSSLEKLTYARHLRQGSPVSQAALALAAALFAIASMLPARACAQDRLELGLMAGGSYYLGEMNPSRQFKMTRPAAAFFGRYMANDRIAIRGQAGYFGIAGKYDDKSPDVYSSAVTPSGGGFSEGQVELVRPLGCEFNSGLVDVSFLGEFNFLSFDHMFRKEQTRFTPYLALGLGCTAYSRYSEGAKKRQFVLSLPFGLGVKYKVNKYLRLGLEWTFHKTFTDELECVEDLNGTFDPADPYRNGVHKLTHNNDWFSHLCVAVSFSLWPRSLACNDGYLHGGRK